MLAAALAVPVYDHDDYHVSGATIIQMQTNAENDFHVSVGT